MSTSEKKEYKEIVHREIKKSFDKLLSSIDQLSYPDFVEHCKIWKHEKGAKKLIELALESDRFLGKESKTFKRVCAMFEGIDKKEGSSPSEESNLSNKRRPKSEISDRESNSINEQNIVAGKKLQQRYQIHELKTKYKSFEISAVKIENDPGEIYQSEEYEDSAKLRAAKYERKYMRGPYKNYSREIKEKMVQLYKSNAMPISKISSHYCVPIKNIKRWAENGVDRKQGAGRKRMDPTMEKELLERIKEEYTPGSTVQLNQIKYLALNLSRVEDFKASKGWVLSFIERSKLNSLYQII